MALFKNVFPTMIAAIATVLATMVVAGTASPQARERHLTEEQRAQVEQRLADVRARLDLTPEQESQLQPILRGSFEKRIALLNAHGLTREGGRQPSVRQLRSLREDMDQLRKETESQVDAVLDDRQMSEFRRIQDEMRNEFRERVRENRRR
jgi:hypothetical protein